MAGPAAKDQSEYSVATLPPRRRERQLALVVAIVTLAAFGAASSFADRPLSRADAFVPASMAIVFVTDLVTAVLLFSQFSATRSRALLVLASGYLFSSLIVIPYTLTFPGAFAPAGLFGAGPQAAAWLYVIWRLGLVLAMVSYACLTGEKYTKDATDSSMQHAIYWAVMIVIGLVFAVAWGVTAGGRFMPLLIKDGALIVPLGIHLTGLITLTNALALWLLWTRGRSVLDLWLTVAVCALTAESLMVSLSLTPRYSVGWYSARLISLLVSKVVLIVLLSETAILQIRLSVANRKLERERENKLTSAETVVAALAHEVRQPLSGMTSRAAAGRRFLDRAPPDPNIDKAKTLFEQLGDAAFRANDVFESFLGLFREGSREHQSVDMNALALEAVELLRKELEDHNIVAHMMLAPELPVVQGNRGQLREVILNLLQNSIDAMATTPRQRVISIETARHDPGSISISLEDTGPGIDPNKLANIFDAFVTTKAKGTGLGLAICKMIIERHGGKLSVSSDTHYGGARFEVSLPTNLAAALGAKASASGDALKQV